MPPPGPARVTDADIPFRSFASPTVPPAFDRVLADAGVLTLTKDSTVERVDQVLIALREQLPPDLDDGSREALKKDVRVRLREQEVPHSAAMIDNRLAPPSKVSTTTAPKRRSQATELVELAVSQVELWHTPNGEAYGTVTVAGHSEHHPLRRVVRRHLAREYYLRHQRAASSQALTDALTTLGGIACFDGAEHTVSVRLAEQEGTLYLDLGDPEWSIVAIDAAGWRFVTAPPVRHWRPASLRPLAAPACGGSLDALRELWTVDEDAWTLIVSWLIATLQPRGPYPILVEVGEQGAGKSTLGRMLRGLVDPAKPELRGVPRDERDVMIGALSSHVVALDNLSGLPPWLSDALCRIATGGGLATRTLYSDLEETLIDVTRPILLTGIESPASRGDLIDRALVVTLPTMSDEARGDEAELWQRYHAMGPALLGALLDATSCALRRRADVRLSRRPRMADACTWVTAAEPALGWSADRTLTAWMGAREQASADLVAVDPVAQAVLAMPAKGLPWTGTAAELLELLSPLVPDAVRSGRTWPTSPRGLAGGLRRLAPDLRRAGRLEVQDQPREARTGRRLLKIVTIVTPSRTPVDIGESGDDAGDKAARPSPIVTAPSPVSGRSDDGDDGDDAAPTPSRHRLTGAEGGRQRTVEDRVHLERFR